MLQRAANNNVLFHHAEYTEYLSENLTVVDDDWLHLVVLWLQADAVLLLVEALHGGGVVNQGNNDLAVLCGIAAVHEDKIAVHDADREPSE